MSIRILYDRQEGRACLYDSVSDTAFGPVTMDDAEEDGGLNAEQRLFDALDRIFLHHLHPVELGAEQLADYVYPTRTARR